MPSLLGPVNVTSLVRAVGTGTYTTCIVTVGGKVEPPLHCHGEAYFGVIFFPRSPFGLQVWCFGEPESIYFNGDMYLGVKSKGYQYDFPLVWPHDWNRQKLAPAAIFADHFQLGAPVMFPAEGGSTPSPPLNASRFRVNFSVELAVHAAVLVC